MLPLDVLRTAKNLPILIELKSGETYNGHLKGCDNWMNICLVDVICTSRDGDRFYRMPECYIRGTNVKYLRIPDDVIKLVKEEQFKGESGRGGRGGFRGNRGRGGGGRGGFQGDRGGRGGGGNRGGFRGRGRN